MSTSGTPIVSKPGHIAPRRRILKRRTLATVVWVVVLVAVVAVVLYPLAWMIAASFKPNSEFGSNQGFFPQDATIDNYIKVLSGVAGIPLATFFLNSLLLAVGAVIGTVISSSMAAYAFARLNFRGRPLFFTVMIGTLLLPFHVLIIPQYMIFRNLEMIDTYWPLLIGKFLAPSYPSS